ncbi:MAG: M48 family metallopeptidase [Phycisphaerae bacterium]
MYFLVIIAFALLLAEGMPPPSLCLWTLSLHAPARAFGPVGWTVLVAAGAIVVGGLVGALGNWLTLRRAAENSDEAFDHALDWQSRAGLMLLGTVGAGLFFLLIFTPWIPLVRDRWRLGPIPVLGDLLILAPFCLSVLAGWLMLYPAERHIRAAAMQQRVADGLAAHPVWGRAGYLAYKLRHQVLIVAAPMLPVLLVKHYLLQHKTAINSAVGAAWATDALLGTCVSTLLVFAPVFVRYVWLTRRLPDGELRQRLERQCRRINLKYREILVWDSHGLVVNAAVMGFFAPVRYVMLSDGLIESMSPRQIEAVFGHEAGHVRHYHLQFFVVFAALAMMIVGGALELLVWGADVDVRRFEGALQLAAMAGTLLVWGLGFGWVSRNFERQADVFGVRAITGDIESCTSDCPVHGRAAVGWRGDFMREPALCAAAASFFGHTLRRIADLNGIPREAPSWRHGSIQSRCVLVHRLAERPGAVARFDRRLFAIKLGMSCATVIGLAIAAWLYRVDVPIALLIRSIRH